MLSNSKAAISAKIFLKPDKRRIHALFTRLIELKKLSTNCFEEARSQILSNDFDQAIIFTGFPKGDTFETDGPIGGIIISDLLKNYLYIPEVILATPKDLNIKMKSLKLSDLTKIKLEPIEHLKIDFKRTTLGIAIEFPGPNSVGVYHHMNGNELDPSFIKRSEPSLIMPNLWYNLNNTNENSLTIGIGDGGNELGIGQYEKEIREIIPFGNICNCPCQKGIASSIPSDIGLLGTTSNWVSFALTSVFEYQLTYQKELSLLRQLNEFGIIDGVTGRCVPTVDGIDPKIEKKVLEKIFNRS